MLTGERLRISLFGEPHFELGGAAHIFRAPPKTLPLLTYLLLHRHGPVPRERAAAALWPDADQATAYGNLRRHLQYLLKALPPAPETLPWLLIMPKTLAWNRESPYWLDIEAFESDIQERTSRSRAVRLYSGDLYERCTEEWIDFERERLRALQLSALAQLCSEARDRSAYVEALQYAQLMLASDPWREDAVRTLMETRMLLGDRSGALAEYERFAAMLREDLQTDPLAETTAAYRRIRDTSRAGSSQETAPHAVAIVGRRNELAILHEGWERASRGEGRAILVGGEAGIGKSTLVRAMLDAVTASGGAALSGGFGPDDESAYSVFGGIPASLGVDLFAPPRDEDERLRAFESFAEALAVQARTKPLAVVLEDLHWAGSAAIDLLRYAILRLRRAPVLFVGTYREFETARTHPLHALRRQLSATHVTHLALSALSREEANALAASCAGRPLGGELLERIYSQSDGNPLFIVELVRALRETGRDNVPASIAEVVAGRMQRLSSEARRLLQTAAVSGSAPGIGLLVTVTGLREADVLQQVQELVAAHFLRQNADETFCFVHDVIRHAVYESIGADAARSLHARIGFALRDLHGDRFAPAAASIAWHFERGGIAAAASDAYLAAAEHAMQYYAADEARDYAAKVLEQAADDERRFRALRVMETAASLRADPRAQRIYAAEMVELGPQLGTEAHAEALLRRMDAASGEPPETQESALRALGAFAESAPEYMGAYLLRRGEYLSRIGDSQGAREPLEQALTIFSRGAETEPLVRAVTALYITALNSGEPLDDLFARTERMRERVGGTGDARVLARLEHLHSGVLLDRDAVSAQDAAERMLHHAREAGDLWLEALAHRSAAACAARRMSIGEAQEHLRRASEIIVASGRQREIARTLGWQTMTENRCGNFEAARAFGEEALRAARACDAQDLVAATLGNLSNAAVWSGDYERAETLLRESLAVSARSGYTPPSVQSLLGEVLVGTGRTAEGIALIEDARRRSSPQDDLLGTQRIHFPLLLGLAYLATGREREARELAAALLPLRTAMSAYYIHPQVYLWATAQLLRFADFEDDAATFARDARRRRATVLATIRSDDKVSRRAFRGFIFNRLIAENAEAAGPLEAWYTPFAERRSPVPV